MSDRLDEIADRLYALDLDHPVQEDIAWAADKIAWLTAEIKAMKALCKEAYIEGMLDAEGCAVRPTHTELEAAWLHSESREVLIGGSHV